MQVGTLRAFETPHAEATLLEHLEHLSRPATTHASRHNARAMLHVLRTLKSWEHKAGRGNATLSAAVRLLLRSDRSFVARMLHNVDKDPDQSDTRCAVACVRSCNPHAGEADCRKQVSSPAPPYPIPPSASASIGTTLKPLHASLLGREHHDVRFYARAAARSFVARASVRTRVSPAASSYASSVPS